MKPNGDTARELFKNNLNRYMNLRNINQIDIVTSLKVSSATASDWVNGIKYPRVDAMQALANLLEVNMSDLMTEHNQDIQTTQSSTNGDLSSLREQLRRQPGMRILFDAGKNSTEEDLIEAARMLERFKKLRDGDES